MADLVKEAVYSSVGAVSLVAEKVQSLVDEFIEQEKLSNKEGKKMVEDFISEMENKKEDLEGKVKKFSDELWDKIQIKKEDDLSDIKDRIARLEMEMSKDAEAAAPVAEVNEEKVKKKVVRKKPTAKDAE